MSTGVIKYGIDKCCRSLLHHMHGDDSTKQSEDEPSSGRRRDKKKPKIAMDDYEDDEDDDAGYQGSKSEKKEEAIFLQIGLRLTSEKRTFGGTGVKIPHPIHPRMVSLCLFVDDKIELRKHLCPDLIIPEKLLNSSSSKGKKVHGNAKGELAMLIDQEIRKKIPGLRLIVTLKDIRSKYNSAQLLKSLMKKFDVFLADDRIFSSKLPKLIGDVFYSSPKRPCPIKIATKLGNDITKRIKSVLRSTFVHVYGESCMIRVGSSEFSESMLIENVSAVIERCPQIIPGGLKSISSIHIKGSNTASLPIFRRKGDSFLDADDDANEHPQVPVGKKRSREEITPAKVPARKPDTPTRETKKAKTSDTKRNTQLQQAPTRSDLLRNKLENLMNKR